MPTFWREIGDVVVKHTVGQKIAHMSEDIDEVWARVSELENRMATAEETLRSFAAAINDETNDIASRLDRLVEQVSSISTGTVTSEDIESVLRPLADRLKGLGQDGTPVVSGTDVGTNTDPTNSPTNADNSPVLPAPDAPTEVPTTDPTVNPVEIPVDNQAGSSSNDAEAQGTVGVPATDPNAIPQPQSDSTTVTETASVRGTPVTPTAPENTNDYSPEV